MADRSRLRKNHRRSISSNHRLIGRIKTQPISEFHQMENYASDATFRTSAASLIWTTSSFLENLYKNLDQLEKSIPRTSRNFFKIQLNKSKILKQEIAFLAYLVTCENIKLKINYQITQISREMKAFLDYTSKTSWKKKMYIYM